jgi:CRISPR-associated protein Cst1
MKDEKIETEWLTRLTGDPFADVGGLVIEYLYHLPEFKGKGIMNLIQFMASVYIDSWQAKLHPFFLNSTITQPAFKGERKLQETLGYFTRLLLEEQPHKRGYCQIAGRKTSVFIAGRDNHILSGSGTFINFHANFQPGIYLCKEMLIRMFFVPFGVQRIADKIGLISSNNRKVFEFFVFQNCLTNLQALVDQNSINVVKSIFNNPANAVFGFTDSYLKYLQNSLNNQDVDIMTSTSLNLYHFSNMGQKPEIALFSMQGKVFDFYTGCNAAYNEDWQKFIRANYNPNSFKDYNFNEVTGKWEKKGEEISFEDYSKWKNLVLNNLLNDRSILKYFMRWNKRQSFPFEIIKQYQTNIRNMKTEALDKIKEIGDFIVTDHSEKFIKDSLLALNGASTRKELRQFLVKIQELSYAENREKPLLNTNEWVEYLFPEQSRAGYWSEVRDIIVITVYQKLHEESQRQKTSN